MKKTLSILPVFFFLIFLSAGWANAQDDETRQSSGLPRMIGENSSNRNQAPLSGKLTVQGLDASQPVPTFYVVVYYSGALVDRRQVDDKGNYFVPSVPREMAILAVEMNGVEVARQQLPSSTMGSIRQDLVINLAHAQGVKGKTGVISSKAFYQRSPENEKIYEKASAAAKEKKSDNAIKLFKDLVKSDPKDFVAWTELGTLYFKGEKYSEAEEAYTKALEQKPDFIVALINLGKLFLAQKQADKAIPVLTKAAQTDAGSPDAQHYLGEAYLQIKKGSVAVGHLNEAIKLAPIEKAEIHLRLAALYNAAGLKDKAVAEYKLFLEKVPQYSEKEKIEKYIKENSPK
ncbi:MAG TPA: tetratricopeptide repeat protein [Pyrinomonadaceae bacterium]|nr:tetratricopeptide repeat protein [Pyrinomonadaceae bacterium]